MRRSLATFLVTLFSVPLISPFLLQSSVPDLPACCRRGGKHHCAMGSMAGADQSQGPELREKCPVFPGIKGLPYSPSLFALFVAKRAVGIRLAASALPPVQRLHSRRLLIAAAPERGPPSFFRTIEQTA